MTEEKTYPHDYRQIFAAEPRPVIVGGQAVNLWALFYLEETELQPVSRKYGSHDLDVLSNKGVLALLQSLPDWRFIPTKWNIFGVGITARAEKAAPDGRKLLVEVLVNVAGLDAADMKHVGEIDLGGTIYRLLDPIAMLKAKVHNLGHLVQDGDPPRHDEAHVKLIAACVPRYLTASHDVMVRLKASDHPKVSEITKSLSRDVSRTFAILTDRKSVGTLISADIDPLTVIPAAFGQSVEPKIARACEHQLPRVRAVIAALNPRSAR